MNPRADDLDKYRSDLSGAGTADSVRQLMRQQLELMTEQISALSHGLSQTTHRSLASPEPSRTPTTRRPLPSSDTLPPHPITQIVQPGLTKKQAEYLAAFAQRYNHTHHQSRDYATRNHQVLADARRSPGFRPAIKDLLYPVVGADAAGAHMRDIDGNRYIDLTMGFGVLLAGHAPAFLHPALASHRATGLDIGPQSNLAGEVAQLVSDLTGMARVSFCNSGTEAVMTALRLVRAATRRARIVTFTDSYHGHFDGVLGLAGGRGSLPMTPGTLQGFVEDVLILDYGTEQALAAIADQADSLAAVLIEPVQSRSPARQPREFLQAVRQITARSGTAMIFDEVLTGFRLALGGAQAWFGVKADIATYGKIVGGGTPIGIVAGDARFLDGIDGGIWGFGDDSSPKAERVFFAGTFNKNFASMAAARAMLIHLQQSGPQLQERLNDTTAVLVQRLNDVFDAERIAGHVSHCSSMFRFVLPVDSDLFFFHLVQNGIYVWEGRTCFLSTAHTAADIDDIVAAVRTSLRDLRSGGFLRQ
jgi:glutamate-1-semialdehyde aminotransferase